jgi:hypothetical protein
VHVLILSRRCPHSQRAWNIVQKNGCADAVRCVFVEDGKIALPSYVTQVPYLVTNSGQKFINNDLFKFIETVLPQHVQYNNAPSSDVPRQHTNGAPPTTKNDASPMPFSHSGGAFSFIDDRPAGGDAMFALVSENYQTIETPSDDSIKLRKMDDNTLDKLLQQRERDTRETRQPRA